MVFVASCHLGASMNYSDETCWCRNSLIRSSLIRRAWRRFRSHVKRVGFTGPNLAQPDQSDKVRILKSKTHGEKIMKCHGLAHWQVLCYNRRCIRLWWFGAQLGKGKMQLNLKSLQTSLLITNPGVRYIKYYIHIYLSLSLALSIYLLVLNLYICLKI